MWWTIYMGLFAFFWWMWNLGINFYFNKHSLAVKSLRCFWALTVLSMHHVLIVQSTCAILLNSERTIFFLWQTLGVSAVFVLCALLCSELCSLLVHWECSLLTHTVHFLARLLYVRCVPFCVLNCMNCLSASSVCVWARLPVFVLLCFASCAVDFSAHPLPPLLFLSLLSSSSVGDAPAHKHHQPLHILEAPHIASWSSFFEAPKRSELTIRAERYCETES